MSKRKNFWDNMSFASVFEELENKRLENYSDFILLDYFYKIKRQHYKGMCRELTLVRYINELEYRGLEYVRVMNYKHKRKV